MHVRLAEGLKIPIIKSKWLKVRDIYPQTSTAAMFPYAGILHVTDRALTSRTTQQTEHITDIFRGSFHKSDSLCYVT